MAHMDPAAVEHLVGISRHWEDNSHRYLDDCHGWEWPRCGQKLVVLVGPSGAGKSTWAARNYDAGSIVSSDAIREHIFGSLDAAPTANGGTVSPHPLREGDCQLPSLTKA